MVAARFIIVLLLLFHSLTSSGCDTYEFVRDNPHDPSFPRITILSPTIDYVNHYASAITVIADVWDTVDSPDRLNITISSDVDGHIATLHADESGRVTKEILLSSSVHVLSLEVENPRGFVVEERVTIYNDAAPRTDILSAKLVDASHVLVEWTQVEDPGFGSYRVYRTLSDQTVEAVFETLDGAVTQFEDVAPVDSLYKYVVVTSSTVYLTENTSDPVEVRRPLFKTDNFGRGVYATMYPNDPVILVSEDRSIPSQVMKVTGYRFSDNETLGTLNYGHTIRHSSVGDNGFGMEIHVSSFGDPGVVRFYDAMDFSYKMSAVWTGSTGNPRQINHVVPDNRGRLVLQTGGSATGSILVSHRADVPEVSGSTYQSLFPGLLTIAKGSNDVFYRKMTGSMPCSRQMYHFRYDDSGEITSARNFQCPHSWANIIGPLVSHPQGTYVVIRGGGRVIESESLTVHAELGTYASFTFDDTGVYLYGAHESGRVDIFQNFSLVGSLQLPSEPHTIFYYEGRLVALVESQVHSGYFGVFTLDAN